MTSTEPGWQPDPSQRHEHRYWDGTSWTEHVADAGVQSTDRLDDAAPQDADGEDVLQDEGPEEEVAGGPKIKRFSIGYTDYLGGHPVREKKHSGGVLRFDAQGVHMRGFRELFVVPWADVTELAVEGSDEVQRRVTASRMLMLGVFAFAAKKKLPKECYVTVATKDGEAIFHCTKVGPHEVKAKLASAARWVQDRNPSVPSGVAITAPPLPAAAPSQVDVMDQIKRLSELHNVGALTDEEFSEKKAELLKRV